MSNVTLSRELVNQALEALKNNAGEMRVEGAINILERALAQQAEPVQEPVAWKQGNLVTVNEDSYPALGGLFVQFWDGEEVAARVYANDLKTLRQRCAKVNTAPPPPQRKPLTEEEMYAVEEEARKSFRQSQRGVRGQQITYWDGLTPWLIRAVERAHNIVE